MDYPQFVEINGKEYKINTDFRIAIKCNEIAEDKTIGDFERALAIIYTLYGDEGLENVKDHEKLIEYAKKFLSCELPLNYEKDGKPDMDYIQDKNLIQSSFKYDYQYNPYNLKYLHWYEFYFDLNNLSNSDFGDCCILSKVRNIRNTNLAEIKDIKERERIQKLQEFYALEKYKKENNLTEEQIKSMEELNKIIGI